MWVQTIWLTIVFFSISLCICKPRDYIMPKINLIQSYKIFVPDAKDNKKEVASITELHDYIESISSQLVPDMNHYLDFLVLLQ